MPRRPVRAGPGDLSASDAIRAVASGRATVEHLILDSRARIAACEPQLGAVLAEIRSPEVLPDGPLAGVLFGVKASIAVGGGRDAGQAATVVRRLVRAGAAPVARLSMAAIGSPAGLTPQTLNPRAVDRISGGSSGGSAAAVAAGLVHVALGADAGGSIRIPAACCGVVGLKPTFGLVPLAGVQSPTYSFDHVGPLTASVADARLVLDVIADTSTSERLGPSQRHGDGGQRPLRIGIPLQTLRSPIDPDVREIWLRALAGLASTGSILRRVDVPLLDSAPDVKRKLGAAEASSVLRDRMSAGVQADSPAVRGLVEESDRIPSSELARCRDLRERFADQLRRVFVDVDVLVTPTVACRVPPRGHDETEIDITVDGVRESRLSALTRFVNPWNLSGVPAGSVPFGMDVNGAPVGVQVVGPWFAERDVLAVMAEIEHLDGGPRTTAACP